MHLKTILLIAAALFLTGCSTLDNWQLDKRLSDLKKGRDVCGLEYLNPFIRTPIDDLAIRDHLPERFSYRIFDPRPFLAGGQDQIVTSDLKTGRQNVEVDKYGVIVSLECY